METRTANTNPRVQGEIDDITRLMIDVEQHLLAVQRANEDFGWLMDELAALQFERKAKKASLVLHAMKKGSPDGDPFEK